jgi:hypothetical protein
MDEDVERFFEGCRADGLCRDKPDTFDHLMEILEKVYRQGDESAALQEFWDDIREIVARKEPRIERLGVVMARLQRII